MRRIFPVLAVLFLLALTLLFPRPYSGRTVNAGNLPPLVTIPAAVRPAPTALLNLNSASLEQLDALPGIGPARAQAIIDYREQNGPFQQVEELAAVEGIGPALLDRVRVYVAIAPE